MSAITYSKQMLSEQLPEIGDIHVAYYKWLDENIFLVISIMSKLL